MAQSKVSIIYGCGNTSWLSQKNSKDSSARDKICHLVDLLLQKWVNCFQTESEFATSKRIAYNSETFLQAHIIIKLRREIPTAQRKTRNNLLEIDGMRAYR